MAEPYFVIEIKDASGQAERHEVRDGSAIVGRSQKRANIVLNDAKASGQHAEIKLQDGRVTVTDMNSTNGTFMDGRRAQQPFVLPPNGSFRIGDSSVRLVAIFGLDEPKPMPTVLQQDGADATRALSGDELDQLRGMGLPPPEPVEKTQAMDVAAFMAGRLPAAAPPAPQRHVEPAPQRHAEPAPQRHAEPAPARSFEAPRRPDPGELRSRQREPEPEPEDDAPRYARIDPDPRGSDRRLTNEPADRTMAFDRASIEIGDFDDSWRAPQGSEPEGAPAGDDWARKAAARVEATDDDDEPSRPSKGTQRLVGFLGLCLAGFIAFALFTKPGAAELPPLPSDMDPMTEMAAQAARLPLEIVLSQVRFAKLIGGEQFDTVEHHLKRLETTAAELGEAKDTAKKIELATELTEVTSALQATSVLLAEMIDRSRMHMLIAGGTGAFAALLLLLGVGGWVGIGAALLLFLAGPLPLVLSQPAPVAPLYFSAGFTLLGIPALITTWRRRK